MTDPGQSWSVVPRQSLFVTVWMKTSRRRRKEDVSAFVLMLRVEQ